MTPLEARARRARGRRALQAWEYRQRDHAKGVWPRLRRLLADAERAFEIPVETALGLVAAGVVPEAAGEALQPPKRILFVEAGDVASLAGAREIPVGLGPDFLAARAVALVRFRAL